jgi:hypothetical protein
MSAPRVRTIHATSMFVAALAAGSAMAGPREAATVAVIEDAGAAGPTDVPAWLKRLPGRYRFDGSIVHREIIDFEQLNDAPPDADDPEGGEVRGPYLYLPEWAQPIQGKGDCINFSEGAGLQCVVNIAWPEQWRFTGKAQLGGVSDMTPANILVGLAPSTAPDSVRFLLIDKRGLAHPGSLVLSGDSATAKVPCVDMPGMQRCDQLLRVTAKADGTMHAELSVTVRFQRSKLDRKRFLEQVPTRSGEKGRTERAQEWVEESLSVSFALPREPRPVAPAATPAVAP